MVALQTNSAPVTKITIIPRTSGALGYTMQVDEGEHNLMSKEEILNRIATLTGGRCAEDLIFHSVTTVSYTHLCKSRLHRPLRLKETGGFQKKRAQ